VTETAESRPTVEAPSSTAARAYQSFLEFDGAHRSGELLLDQLSTWLRERDLEPDLSQSSTLRWQDCELVVVRHDVRGGFDLHLRLVEHKNGDAWRTEMVVHAVQDDAAGWVRLGVTNDSGRFVDVPRLATYVMDTVETRDGPAVFASTPRVVSAGGVDALIDELCDPDRRALAFVAATDNSLPFDAFVDRLGRWTRQVRGLGHVVVLDPLATAAFSEAVGATHEVPPWTVRTYLPDVDPATATDGRRHRILGTRRLGEMDDSQIRMLLGRVARGHASTRTLPLAVTRVRRSLRRLEDNLVLDALVDITGTDTPAIDQSMVAPVAQVDPRAHAEAAAAAGPETAAEGLSAAEAAQGAPVAAQVEHYLAQIELAKAVLGVSELDEVTLRELATAAERGRMSVAAIDRVRAELEEREQRINELEDEVSVWKELFDEAEFDAAVSEDDRSRFEDENRWLRRRLAEREDYEAAYSAVPSEAFTQYPGDFDALMERVEELEQHGVVFTGDPKVTRDLDDHDSVGRLVRAAWEDLLVLSDYVRARRSGEFESGLRTYVDNPPAGYRTVTRKQFAGTETGQTMKGFGDERQLPVPTSVDPSGTATMKAHFKLGRIGMVSPRMYVLDRFSEDGCVYVGYIGAHLTNTQTN
jgi:hypothetical protein